jgi:ATP-dependent RNA helicase SUPV3L1/SUV3
MGLNLNIKRVIFSATRKFNGEFIAPLATTEIKQIGGRAGRFRSAHPEGYVTTLFPKDLALVRSSMDAGFQPILKAVRGSLFTPRDCRLRLK